MKNGILVAVSLSFLLILNCDFAFETNYKKEWSTTSVLTMIGETHENVHGLEVVDLVWESQTNPDPDVSGLYEDLGSQQVWEAFDPDGKIPKERRGEHIQARVRMKYKIICQKYPITVSVVDFKLISPK